MQSTSYGFVKPCQALADSLNVVRPTQFNEFDDEEDDQSVVDAQQSTPAPTADIADTAVHTAASGVTTGADNAQCSTPEATTGL